MSILAPPQEDQEELLDRGQGAMAELRESLDDLRRINKWLGGTGLVAGSAIALIESLGLKNVTILDIGTGGADIPIRLIQVAKRRGIVARVIASDIKPRHLEVAAENVAEAGLAGSVKLLGADAFALPLRDNSVDIVINSLFLHHFRPPEIARLLAEFSRVSRHGFIIGDLVRHRVPLIFMKLTWPIFGHSYLTRHDGEVSIRRGYTVREMRRLLDENGLGHVQVHSRFPFRMLLLGEDKCRQP